MSDGNNQEIAKTTVENNVLAVSKPLYTTNTKIKQKILEEEEYLTILDKIIERDFYPELTRLKLTSSYLSALEENDAEKLRAIQLQLELETPALCRKETPRTFDPFDSVDVSDAPSCTEKVDKDVSLDKFLRKNTSEDNASFEKIMEATREKHREKYAWLYNKQQEQDTRQTAALALTSAHAEADGKGRLPVEGVETWKYVPRNALMYTPEGVEASLEEYLNKKGSKKQTIEHANTRFKQDPFDNRASQSALQHATEELAKLRKNTGKLGVDGRPEHETTTPKVRGYGFVATPSPTPGVEASPLMTWGEVEGTPQRLETPLHNAPAFKIPEPPRREVLAHSLAEKASKQHREKRKKAFAAATASLFSPKMSPAYERLTAERMRKLSPAAQKLVRRRTGGGATGDKTLRDSYSPSPRNFKMTPSPKVNGTPGAQGLKRRRIKTPGTAPSEETSITDDLLKLPVT